MNGAYLRLPWALIEPEEGHFLWESLDTPAQRWIDQGLQVSFRISALEPWMYKATPQWVFDAGAKGFDAEGWVYEPDYDDPIYLEKVEHFVKAMAERYDGSPHVAFVDIGHMGMWGEDTPWLQHRSMVTSGLSKLKNGLLTSIAAASRRHSYVYRMIMADLSCGQNTIRS